MIFSFTGTGHGAPACAMSTSDDVSYFSNSSAGTSSSRMKCAGTMNVFVTRCFSTRASHSRAFQLGRMTVVAPTKNAAMAQPPGPAWYAGPETM